MGYIFYSTATFCWVSYLYWSLCNLSLWSFSIRYLQGAFCYVICSQGYMLYPRRLPVWEWRRGARVYVCLSSFHPWLTKHISSPFSLRSLSDLGEETSTPSAYKIFYRNLQERSERNISEMVWWLLQCVGSGSRDTESFCAHFFTSRDMFYNWLNLRLFFFATRLPIWATPLQGCYVLLQWIVQETGRNPS